MRTIKTAGFLAFLMATMGWAAESRKAMVLRADGPQASLTQEGKKIPVVRGQMWNAGDRISLPAKSTLTVMLLSQGKRLQVEGPANVTLQNDGIDVKDGGKVRELKSVEHKLALSGENHRQFGGMTVRNAQDIEADPFRLRLDRVEYPSAGAPIVLVSSPPSSGRPPTLMFQFYDSFSRPNISADGRLAIQNFGDQAFAAREVAAVVKNGAWEYRVEVPGQETSRTLGLRVYNLENKELLYTRLYAPGPEDLDALEAARRNTEQWVELEPQSSDPWLVYACILEEKGQLTQALEALETALKYAPKDPGLLRLKTTLFLDLGRYSEALELFKGNG